MRRIRIRAGSLRVRLADLADQLAIEVIARTDCVYRVGHLISRQGQHLIAQSLIERRQAIQSEQSDQQPERRSINQQSEEHEAGSEHRDEALHRRTDRGILSHRQRQRQGHRAAQSSPYDHRLERVADLLTQTQRAQHRQHSKQHGRSRDQCRCDQHAKQSQIMPADVLQHPGHEQRRQYEDQ